MARLAHRFIVLCALLALPSAARAAVTLDLYGTFESMGVTVTLAAGDDPDQDASASVEYRAVNGSFAGGLPLVRLSLTRMVGSLFWLSPGTAYEVRVSFADPDGGPLDGTSVTSTASTRAEVSIPSPTHTLVASPAGSGSACTLAAPCALGQAIGQATAGEAVALRGGVYLAGDLDMPRSGSAGAPIVVRSYPGETAILDGSDPGPLTWTAQGGGVYRTTVSTPDPHLALADGQRLFPYTSLADLQSLRWGVPGLYASGTSLYVRLAGNADPATRAMVISRRNTAFTLDGLSFVYFVDLAFRYYGCGEYSKTIYLFDASDNLVQGCIFTACDIGVALKYTADRNVIQDCSFSDTVDGFPWDGVKQVGTLEDGGFSVYDPMDGRGTVIRRNTFEHDFDALHLCPESPGETMEADVSDNTMRFMGDDGMETDGECSNVRIFRNTFHDVRMGVSLAPVETGPVYVLRNLIYRIGYTAEAGSGSGFKLNSGYDESGPIFLFHNTVDAVTADQSAFTIFEPGSWRQLVARNNVFSGTLYALQNSNVSQPLDLDSDDLFTSQPGELAWWQGLGHLHTLAELQAATGLELGGLAEAPALTDPGEGDYEPSPTSPLVDRGVLIPGVDADYSGSAPDIGAFEVGQPLFADGFESGSTPAWSAVAP